MVTKKKKAKPPTKKAVKKKPAKKKASPGNRTIVFACDDGTCEPDNDRKHLFKNFKVDLTASNIDVSLVFDLASPFVSGDGHPSTNPLKIAKGKTVQETVKNQSGTFSYTISCTNPFCASSVDNPEMVVP
jgi:hypothetical protein